MVRPRLLSLPAFVFCLCDGKLSTMDGGLSQSIAVLEANASKALHGSEYPKLAGDRPLLTGPGGHRTLGLLPPGCETLVSPCPAPDRGRDCSSLRGLEVWGPGSVCSVLAATCFPELTREALSHAVPRQHAPASAAGANGWGFTAVERGAVAARSAEVALACGAAPGWHRGGTGVLAAPSAGPRRGLEQCTEHGEGAAGIGGGWVAAAQSFPPSASSS